MRASDLSSGTKLFHGTCRPSAVSAILASMVIEPQDSEALGYKKRGVQTPLPGRSYFTPSLEYAVVYAIGGYFMGHEPPPSFSYPRYGYVFAVDARDLRDVLPDEDIVGELAAAAVEDRLDKPYAAELASLARGVLTPLQLKKLKFDMNDQIRAGKKLLKHMFPWMIKAISAESHVSSVGPVPVREAWCFERARCRELLKDASNFFDLADRVA